MPNHDIKKLVVRAPNWIGDAVMSEPALATLRGVFPRAEVTLLAKPAVAELFQGHPGVDRVLVYEARGRHGGVVGKWRLARTLRHAGFDMAILLQNAFEAGLLTWLARIPRRYGYATDGRGWLLTDPIPVPAEASRLHQADYFHRVLDPLASSPPRRAPRLSLTLEEEQALANRLKAASVEDRDLLVGLNPGSTYGTAKRWLPERFAQTADALVERLGRQDGAGVRVVVVGAKGEEAVGEVIAQHMTHVPIQLAGQTTIRELMALVKRCRVFISNDTGPMHIAAAFGVPVVALFGPTDPATTSPAGGAFTVVRHPVDCAPCLLRECPIDHRCMTGISVDTVVEAAVQITRADKLTGERPGRPGPASVASYPNNLSACQPVGLSAPPERLSGPLAGVTVFLDRDGTLNRDSGYIGTPDDLELFPSTGASIARLNHAGARVVLITNQSGVGRGYFSSDDLTRIHQRLRDLLGKDGARLDGVYACPHHPDDGCACRKPGTALVERAVTDLGLDLSQAYVIGDQERDVELAQRIGAKGILVTTGVTGADVPPWESVRAVAPDLAGAVDWIMEDVKKVRSEK